MKIQLIRNATMKLTYAGQTILTDPMLSDKGGFRSFAGIAPNPTIDLPLAIEEILRGVDLTIISHLHPDHFDEAAATLLAKDMAIYCPPGDAAALREKGFAKVTAIETTDVWKDISITRTGGKHGSGKILARLGEVSGFVLQAPGEPKVYWVGDSIWCEEVALAIEAHKPDIIIVHAGGATLPGFDPIIMDCRQTLTALRAAPNATVVAVHMESLDHCTVARDVLRRAAKDEGIAASRLLIPGDGETLIV
ncbi:MAG: MBL fold metallo-hydrolase [Desulforhopalus sp.]|nr:MBL fold metallo-hydrolase [Desulforhopalus sp.]